MGVCCLQARQAARLLRVSSSLFLKEAKEYLESGKVWTVNIIATAANPDFASTLPPTIWGRRRIGLCMQLHAWVAS